MKNSIFLLFLIFSVVTFGQSKIITLSDAIEIAKKEIARIQNTTKHFPG